MNTPTKQICRTLILVILMFQVRQLYSQQVQKDSIPPNSQMLGVGVSVPIFEFTTTHYIGVSIEYAKSRNRMGFLNIMPAKMIGFLVKAGIDHYFGKSVSTIPFNPSFIFDHYNFTYIKAYGGMICNLSKRTNINLTAGPALGLEKNYNRVWWGVDLSGTYFFNRKWGISPTLSFMKDSGSDPLFTTGLKASMAF